MIRPFMPPLLLMLLALGGCSRVTAVQNVSLPPVTVIEGTLQQVWPEGFELQDASGSIFVRTDAERMVEPALQPHEHVTVYGNLAGSQQRIFDAYVIQRANGQKIILHTPTPHLGFVAQPAF